MTTFSFVKCFFSTDCFKDWTSWTLDMEPFRHIDELGNFTPCFKVVFAFANFPSLYQLYPFTISLVTSTISVGIQLSFHRQLKVLPLAWTNVVNVRLRMILFTRLSVHTLHLLKAKLDCLTSLVQESFSRLFSSVLEGVFVKLTVDVGTNMKQHLEECRWLSLNFAVLSNQTS